MEQVSEEEFNKIIESGKPLMLIVPKGKLSISISPPFIHMYLSLVKRVHQKFTY